MFILYTISMNLLKPETNNEWLSLKLFLQRSKELFSHLKNVPDILLNNDIKAPELKNMIRSYTTAKTLDEKDLYAIYLLTSVYAVNNVFSDKTVRLEKVKTETIAYLQKKWRNFHVIFFNKIFTLLEDGKFTKPEIRDIIQNIQEVLKKDFWYYRSLWWWFQKKDSTTNPIERPKLSLD